MARRVMLRSRERKGEGLGGAPMRVPPPRAAGDSHTSVHTLLRLLLPLVPTLTARCGGSPRAL